MGQNEVSDLSNVCSVTVMSTQTPRPLGWHDAYPCPICRHGQVEAMVLTEAFACNFCRHILSANLKQQQVQVLDSTQAIAWQWDGSQWRIARGNKHANISGLVILTSVILVALPASLVGVAGFVFPPASPTPGIAFSTIWALLTLAAHTCLVLWLIAEYYQIPFYIATRIRLLQQRLLF